MLTSLLDFSSLSPVEGLTRSGAVKVSFCFTALASASVILTLLLLLLSPSTFSRTSIVSSTILASPFECTMLKKVSKVVEVSRSFSSSPLQQVLQSSLPLSGGVPLSALEDVSSNVVLCGLESSPLISYSVQYPTYEACLLDTAALSCSAGQSKLPPPPAVPSAPWRLLTAFVSCRAGNASFGGVHVNFAFSPGPEPGSTYGPPKTKPGCDRSLTLLQDNVTLSPGVYSPEALTSAVGAVFTPAALCVPFEPNKNPPYLCAGRERQAALTILLQAASMYSTSVGVLVGAILLLLHISRRVRGGLVKRGTGATGTSGYILKGLRSLSTIPLIFGTSEARASQFSMLIRLFSCAAATMALAMLYYYPPLFPSVTLLLTSADPSFECASLSPVTMIFNLGYSNGSLPFSKRNMGLAGGPKPGGFVFTPLPSEPPLASSLSGVPFASLFVASTFSGPNAYRGDGLLFNPNSSAYFCAFCPILSSTHWDAGDYGCPVGSSNVAELAYKNVFYATHDSCLADVSSSVACTITQKRGPPRGFAALTPYYISVVSCTFGSQSRGTIELSLEVLDTLLGLGVEPELQPLPLPQCTYSVNYTSLLLGESPISLIVRNYTTEAVARAISAVLTPRILCFPFEENPPYVCTGKQRASILTIVVESLSFYGSASWVLTTGLVSALQLREYTARVTTVYRWIIK